MAPGTKFDRYALIDVLNAARPDAEPPPSNILLKYLRFYDRGQIGVDGIAAVRIAEVMSNDPVITEYVGKYLCAGPVLYSLCIEDLALWLWNIYKGVRSASSAVEEFDSIISENSAPGSTFILLNNISFDGVVEVGNDISLLPKSNISRLESYKSVASYLRTVNAPCEPSAAIVREHPIRPLFAPLEQALKVADAFKCDLDRWVEDLKNCLGLVGPCAPVRVATWTEFHDNKAPRSGKFLWRNDAAQYLPLVAPLGVFDKSKAAKLVTRFLKLTPEIRTQLHVPLQRLNAALRQASIVDRAIDLGVGLEALLLHDISGSDGLQYRFALRGATFLVPPGEERKTYFYKFRELYRLRSTAVHKGHIAKPMVKLPNLPAIPCDELLRDGEYLCASLISAIIDQGHFPDWEDVILFNSVDL